MLLLLLILLGAWVDLEWRTLGVGAGLCICETAVAHSIWDASSQSNASKGLSALCGQRTIGPLVLYIGPLKGYKGAVWKLR